MPDIGRKRQHRLIDIYTLCLPQHDAANNECVPLIPLSELEA
jgi:hypothetical protein